MGRVARYKKIKSVDPYAKAGNRSNVQKRGSQKLRKKEEKRNRDDPYPKDDFDMADIVGSVRREKKVRENLEPETMGKNGIFGERSVVTPGIPTADTPAIELEAAAQGAVEEAKLAARIMNIPRGGTQAGEGKDAEERTKIEGRKEGESAGAFRERMRATTSEILRDDLEVRQGRVGLAARKKEFLNKKKKRGKKKRSLRAHEGTGTDDEGEGERRSMFGDQVERPPEFKHLPRGAKATKGVGGSGGDAAKPKSDREGRKADAVAMEKLRQRAVAQYAMVKAKRKREGGAFHL